MDSPDRSDLDRLPWRTASFVAAGVCGVIGLVECAKDYVMVQIQGTERAFLSVLRDQALWWVLWMLLMPVVIWLAQTFRLDRTRWLRSAGIHTIIAVALSVGHITVFGAAYFSTVGPTAWGPTTARTIDWFMTRYLATDIIIYGGAVSVYYAIEYVTRFRRLALASAQTEAHAARLQLSLAEARIHALRMELNPHFLFNALNAVAGLVRRREHDGAVDMLARLSDLLRTTLDREMPAEVPLSEELVFLGRFVDIEQVRFGDRLRVTWDVDPDVRTALVPPLLLQPLVENAVRHGISRRPGPAALRISARRVGLHLELTVRDSGDGLAHHDSAVGHEGIGLSNTRERLVALYGEGAATLDVADAPGGGVRARIMVPFHTTQQPANTLAVGA